MFGEEINPFSTIRLSLFVLAAATTVLARQNRELRLAHDFFAAARDRALYRHVGSGNGHCNDRERKDIDRH